MKIALCTPHYSDVTAQYAYSLAHLFRHTLRTRPDIDLTPFLASSAILPKARTQLVGMALEWGADWILWIDADHLFPPDSLLRLLARNLDVVGVNYPRRQAPAGPTAASADDDGNWHPVWTTAEKARSGLVEPVDTMGLGLCLMRAELVRRLHPPLFGIEPLPDGGFLIDDAWFFAKLRQAGVAIHVDHGLSWEVGHVTEQILTHAGLEQSRGAAADRT